MNKYQFIPPPDKVVEETEPKEIESVWGQFRRLMGWEDPPAFADTVALPEGES